MAEIIKFPVTGDFVFAGKIKETSFPRGTLIGVPEGFMMFAIQNGKVIAGNIYDTGIYEIGEKTFPSIEVTSEGVQADLYYYRNGTSKTMPFQGNVSDRNAKSKDGTDLTYNCWIMIDYNYIDPYKLGEFFIQYDLKPTESGLCLGKEDIVDILLIYLDESMRQVYDSHLEETYQGTTWNVRPVGSRSDLESRAIKAVEHVTGNKLKALGFAKRSMDINAQGEQEVLVVDARK